jgi:fucose 4-O-acetylase-like acetyltransferase
MTNVFNKQDEHIDTLERDLKAKLRWVNIAKGIGITLVVIGHYFPANSPSYWHFVHDFIYTFHMPLFFIISGYLYKFKEDEYMKLIVSKLQRLAIPFLSTAFVYSIFKLIAGNFVQLDNPVNLQSALQLLVDPVHSFVPLLWFVHALFGIFLIYPLVRTVMQPVLIFVVALLIAILYNILEIYIPVLSKVIENLPYFAFGVVCADKALNEKLFRLSIGKVCIYLLLALIVCSTSYVELFGTFAENISFLRFLPGLVGGMTAISLSILIEKKCSEKQSQLFEVFGICSMGIYLFHAIFESAVRIVFAKFQVYLEIHFLIVAMLAIFIGLAVPTLIEIFILRKSNILSKLFLGVRLSGDKRLNK